MHINLARTKRGLGTRLVYPIGSEKEWQSKTSES